MSLRRLHNESDASSITVFADYCTASVRHRVNSNSWISYLQKKRDASMRRTWMEEYNIYLVNKFLLPTIYFDVLYL